MSCQNITKIDPVVTFTYQVAELEKLSPKTLQLLREAADKDGLVHVDLENWDRIRRYGWWHLQLTFTTKSLIGKSKLREDIRVLLQEVVVVENNSLSLRNPVADDHPLYWEIAQGLKSKEGHNRGIIES